MAKISMADVARHAGVSTATVSHVINNTRFVSEETRKRVQASIDTLGYSPDLMARIFKTGKKNLIGFVVPDIANTFFANIIEAVEDAIGEYGYRLIVSNTKECPETEIENLRILSNGIVDGLIVASTLSSFSPIKDVIPKELPIILVDRELKGCPSKSIVISNYDAVYRVVELLVAKGHRRIGYISGLSHLSTTKERLSAYTDALGVYGIQVEPELICTGTSMHDSVDDLASNLLKQKCTAMIVSNNAMTDDILNYLDTHGLLGKIDVVGYNDNGYQSYVLRRIYSIQQPADALGWLAGQQIVDLIENRESSEAGSLSATLTLPEKGL